MQEEEEKVKQSISVQMITKVEFGTTNDDFLCDRVTGKAVYNDGSYFPFKRYANGCLVGFDDQRFTGGEYRETPLDEETHLLITQAIAGL